MLEFKNIASIFAVLFLGDKLLQRCRNYFIPNKNKVSGYFKL